MKFITRAQLSSMFFLEFFIWGGWFVTLGTYLGANLQATGAESSMAFSTQSWGAIIAPFIVGLIADKFINAERILGILHLIGAFLMYQMSQATEFDVFYPYVLGYMIAYMPTLALVNSVAFNALKDPSKQFPFIRVWGTIGWIISGLLISFVFEWDSIENLQEGMLSNTFLMVAIASGVLGIFSFTLPKTPPSSKGEKVTIKDVLGFEALGLLKNKNFLIFFISSILISIPLAFYYQSLSPFLTESKLEKSTALISVGQASEIIFMLLLPFFFKKFGFKKTILAGMLAWVIRYVLFAYGNIDELFFMLLIGIALHGLCYDFFFVSGQIYTDSKASKKIKSAAQGLITLATYGVGMLIGFWVVGLITDSFIIGQDAVSGKDLHDWRSIWLYPAGFAGAVFVFFLLSFKDEKVEYNQD